METRAQKRKREADQSRTKEKISKTKNIENLSTDISKQQTKLVILLDRINLEGCERNHEHIALRINPVEEQLLKSNEIKKQNVSDKKFAAA